MKKLLIAAAMALTIASCGAGGPGTTGNSETTAYLGYSESGPINNFDMTQIQARQVEFLNAARIENGLTPLALSPQLTASALTHARDIAAQQRAWNYGSDKSTPQTRANRAGFSGVVTGENVSETYRGELQVIQSWLADPMSRAVILDPNANSVGISYYQERSGKVWWVHDFGAAGLNYANY